MPNTDFLPEGYPDAPVRANAAEQDEGRVRKGDYTIAADLLRMEKARDAAYVKEVLKTYQEQKEDPLARETVPAPFPNQPVFLVGERLQSDEVTSRRSERAKHFGQWIGNQFLRRADTASITKVEGWMDHRIVVAEFKFPVEELVEAGFRREDSSMNAFDPSYGIWKASHEAVHQSRVGLELLRKLGPSSGLDLAGPYAAKPSFQHGAKWALYHSSVKDWMPQQLGRGQPKRSPQTFKTDGFQLDSQDGQTVRARILGYFDMSHP